jgi:putative N6-adenine-specific DNA methylase
MDWPDFDAELWRSLVERAQEAVLPSSSVPISGSDRDAGALSATAANAERAGVVADVATVRRTVSALEPPSGASEPGWLVTNPPYGLRVGERERLRDLYARLGATARKRLPGWTVVLLSADRRLEAQVGIELRETLRTTNGGIGVRVMVGKVEQD